MRKTARKQKGIEKLTLGQLVAIIMDNERYSRSLPKKYHPLLELCNEYRIFSVHAKTERITKRVASSVLSLSIEFLFDESLVPRTREGDS